MFWSIVSNAFCKSIQTIPIRRPETNALVTLSWKYDKQVYVEWHFRKPDCYLYRTLLSGRKFKVWSWIIRSVTLEISGSREMGLKFLRPLLYKGLTFATLHLSEKEVNFMERLQILAIDIRSVFEPSLRNLPTRLSTIVALLVLNFFNIFEIETELFQI